MHKNIQYIYYIKLKSTKQAVISQEEIERLYPKIQIIERSDTQVARVFSVDPASVHKVLVFLVFQMN